LPDGEYDLANHPHNTKIQYCTYGPSFRNSFFFFFSFISVTFLLIRILFFIIKSIKVPFPPTNLQLTQKSSTSASLSWTASSGSGVYYKIITSTTTKSSSTSTTWNSLSPATTYTLYVYAGKNNPTGGAETYETAGMIYYFILFLINHDMY